MDTRVCIYDFAVALGSAARIFTLQQVARHPNLSGRTQPIKRASEVLKHYPDSFDVFPGPVGEPYRFRLSKLERQKHGITWHNVDAQSQRVDHWLGLGDMWMSLTFASGRPDMWVSEPVHVFDAYCVWRGVHCLIEYQRSKLSRKAWQRKWMKRKAWYDAQQWDVKPYVCLVNLTQQPDEIVCAPPGTIHVRRVEDLPRALMKL